MRIINGDQATTSFYVDKIIEGFAFKNNANAGLNQRGIAEMVRTRANHIVKGGESVTDRSLAALESTLRTAGRIDGRKLVFFISDGFFLDTKGAVGGANTRFQRVSDLAARTGSVFYTVDARGLFAPVADATGQKPLDPAGRLDRSSFGEGLLSQEGLNALAGDTGGEFLKNTNYFDRWVSRRLEETSRYYLLAWRPSAEEQKGGRFRRMEVTVAGRPDLSVRLHRGYLVGNGKQPKAADDKGGAKVVPAADSGANKAGDDVREALTMPLGYAALPTVVSTSFVDVPGTGPVLTSSVQVSTANLGYGADGKQTGTVDLAGIVLNEQGKQAATFKTRLNVTPPAAGSGDSGGVIYNHRAPLAPGIYQVRVAARDDRTGQVGADSRWVEIPDLSKKQLALSSLHLGGRAVGGPEGGQVQFSVDHRFARGAKVDFLGFVYNAARGGAGAPELSAQVKVWRDGRAVVTGPSRRLQLEAGADAARVPVTGGLTLGQLPPGLYELEVTVTDQTSKASAAQRVDFEIQ